MTGASLCFIRKHRNWVFGIGQKRIMRLTACDNEIGKSSEARVVLSSKRYCEKKEMKDELEAGYKVSRKRKDRKKKDSEV